jgi:hypothetical protein
MSASGIAPAGLAEEDLNLQPQTVSPQPEAEKHRGGEKLNAAGRVKQLEATIEKVCRGAGFPSPKAELKEQALFFYQLSSRLVPLVDKATVTRILAETEHEIRRNGTRQPNQAA